MGLCCWLRYSGMYVQRPTDWGTAPRAADKTMTNSLRLAVGGKLVAGGGMCWAEQIAWDDEVRDMCKKIKSTITF